MPGGTGGPVVKSLGNKQEGPGSNPDVDERVL